MFDSSSTSRPTPPNTRPTPAQRVKVFARTIREKFPWAMAAPTTFIFHPDGKRPVKKEAKVEDGGGEEKEE